MERFRTWCWFLPILIIAAPVSGQSSSLYTSGPGRAGGNGMGPGAAVRGGASASYQPRGGPAGTPAYTPARPSSSLSPAIARASLAAVPVPQPRRFAMHDLITIIVRESNETSFDSKLDTDKSSRFEGAIEDFPNLELAKLLEAQLEPGDMENGGPKLNVDFSNEFESEGEYNRSASVTGRMTARVIDIKPNGSLVLEARKHIQSDEETLRLRITGTCRARDVSIDNTILSTQLFNLRLNKEHKGELRKTTRKGLLTKILETIFNF